MKEFYEIKNDKLSHLQNENKFLEFEIFLKENKKTMTKYELAKGYLELIYHYCILNNFEKSKIFSEKMISFLKNDNYYSMILENLNYLFYFFGCNNKFVNNYLLEKYEKIIMNNSNFKKEDFEALVNITLDSE